MSGLWLWWILAGVYGLSGMLAFAWAIFWDRSRGRRRCPKCWYDMAGVPELVCPECGRAMGTERQLYGTRRRWLVALGAAGMTIVPGVTFAWPGAAWWAPYAPTWLLVRVVEPPTVCFNNDPVSHELERRLKTGPLGRSSMQVLIDRVTAKGGYGADRLLLTRLRWPEGRALPVSGSTNLSFFFLTCYDNAVNARVRLLSTAAGRPGEWIELDGRYLIDPTPIGLPEPASDGSRVEVELRFQDQVIWSGIQELEAHIRGTPGDLLSPVSDPDLDAAFAAWLKASLDVRDPNRVWVSVMERDRESVFGRYVALGLRLRLRLNGEVVVDGEYAYSPPLGGPFCGNEPDTTGFWLACNRKLTREEAAGDWELEVTGDRDLAMLDYDRYGWGEHIATPSDSPWTEPTEYWAGYIRVPVVASLNNWQN